MVPKDLVYIGLRDLDTPEKMLIRELGIKAYTVSASREIPTIKCSMISTKSS
jgi:arginase family enzyme